VAQIAAGLLIFIFLLPYSASVYKGIGFLFEQVFGLSFAWCMVLIAVLTAAYVLAGGYFASSWSNFFQGIVMLGGIGLMVYFLLMKVGGLSAALEKLPAAQTAAGAGGGKMSDLFSVVVLTSLGTLGLPQMVHKFYAVRDGKKSIRSAMWISTLFALIIGSGAYLVGALGPLFMNKLPEGGTDYIVPAMLNDALPSALMGLIVVLLLAASMSTLSALAMSAGSAVAVDLFGPKLEKMGKKKTNLVLRIVCFAFIMASMIFALYSPAAIQTLMNYSWGVLAGAFLGPFIFGVCWKKATPAGGWAGFIAGLGTCLVLGLIYNFAGNKSATVGCWAMVASLIATPLVSLLTPAKKTS